MITPLALSSRGFRFASRLAGGLTAAAVLSLSHTASAAMLAADNASNTTYSGGQYGGLNGGTGFAAWNVTGSNNGNTSAFYGSYVGGTGGLTGSQFGLYSGDVGTGAFANAVRAFSGNTSLTIGQTFSVDLDNTAVGANGLIGLSLQNTAGTTEVNLQSDGTTWTLAVGTASINLGADTAGTVYHFALTYNGGSSYSYTFTGAAAGNSLTASNTISDISQANFFDFEQGAGQNFGFNNLAVVPEPSSIALVALGLTGVVVSRRCRH